MNWLNQIVDEVIARHPEGEILIESGGSPSGTHHLGHMRELVTCDAILLELRRRGRQARHMYFVDDLDVFRKVPINVPPEWEKYLGMPICDVPAPDDSDQSYADYFLQSLVDGCKALNVEVEFVRSHPKYRSGWFADAIGIALDNTAKIKHILEELSNRTLPDDWAPVQILDNGRLKNRKVLSVDKAAKTVVYEDTNGQHQTAHYDRGEVKMDWRIDWPARWWLLKPAVEPFGREHASAGGSYETGARLMQEIFKADPPLPVPYDSIHMAGDTKKMSASKGTAISAVEAAQIMPPEVVRYFILRAPLNRPLAFDPADSVVKLIDEYAALMAKPEKTEFETQLLNACNRGQAARHLVSRIPFSHLVASYQASLKDTEKTLEVIKRTEHAQAAEEDAEIIREELKFIDTWLERRAPEDVKFALTERVDPAEFSEEEQVFLKSLGEKVAAAPKDADGTYFHERMYELKDEMGLQPKDMFGTLYRALIGKTSGPRAGWFLSILPRDWLVERLLLRGNIVQKRLGDPGQGGDSSVGSVRLDGAMNFSIEESVRQNFPHASIGYLVAAISQDLQPLPSDPITGALQALQSRGVTAENVTIQPEIAVWREAFKTFGVKPSKYLCSAEALAKRALKGNPARVSPLVDAYNAISIKYLIPMGAIDMDKLHGDLVVRYGQAGEIATLLGVDGPVEVMAGHIVYADQQQIVTWLWNHRDAVNTAVGKSTKRVLFVADSLSGPAVATQAVHELAGLLQQAGVTIVTQGVIGQVPA
jgi:lysyl-tRNA synthetase, class I